MIYEIISTVLLLDSAIALLIACTKVGDRTIERHILFRRYLPLTPGWGIVYATLTLYIAYLTFFVL